AHLRRPGHLNIPKLHFLNHYLRAIKLFGSTNNYNTEATERLHIDFAKLAYRATNRKDEYPQMTKWLEHREKILHHSNFISWQDRQRDGALARDMDRWRPSDLSCKLIHKMTRHPSQKAVPITDITSNSYYAATYLLPALARLSLPSSTPLIYPVKLRRPPATSIFLFTVFPSSTKSNAGMSKLAEM
ncbi:hypothetical protein DXG03_002541, partial [Asterophora parasitica]